MGIDVPGWIQVVQLLKGLLQAINSVVGSPGIAIIIFTFIVKTAMLPLTLKSFRSMRQMQRIQPLIKEVNKRYKDDKTKQQAEVMRVYKEHGVNPAGGCLPALIQMPIFFALSQALYELVGLRPPVHGDPSFTHAFLWVPSLAHADPLFIWPVVSAFLQFINTRVSQPYGVNKNMDSQQAMTNNIMQFMPVMMLVFYSNFPAGAVIYWTFQALFGIVQTYFVNGFGTLPDLPGLHWLPKKPLPVPTPRILEEVAEIDARADTEKRPARVSKPVIAVAAASGGAAAAYRLPDRRPQIATNGNTDGNRRKGFMEKMMEQAQALAAEQERVKQEAAAARAAESEAVEATDGNGFKAKVGGNGSGMESAEMPTAATLPAKRKNRR
ncbi:MAG: membrane protein insertase YidC [Chloroflexia bacterium]